MWVNCGLQPEKVKFQLRLGQSKPIYNAFKAIQESPDWPSLSDARKRIVECEFLKYLISSLAERVSDSVLFIC
jgi:oligopeptidase A